MTQEALITVENFRNIVKAQMHPVGLCAFTGPSGSGKTSFLDAVAMATAVAGTTPRLRTHDYNGQASKARSSSVSIDVGADKWSVSRRDEHASWDAESIHAKGRSFSYHHDRDDEKRKKQDVEEYPSLRDLLKRVLGVAVLRSNRDRWESVAYPEAIASDDSDVPLDRSGLLARFRLWRRYEHRDRFSWTIETMRALFPDIDYIDVFDPPKERKGALGSNYSYISQAPSFVRVVRDGGNLLSNLEEERSSVIRSLEVIAAVARMDSGDVLFVEEIERGLDPFTLGTLLSRLDDRAESRGLNIVIETQSRSVLSFFQNCTESIFVMENGRISPLSELVDPSWTATYKIGDIYGSAYGRSPYLVTKEAP